MPSPAAAAGSVGVPIAAGVAAMLMPFLVLTLGDETYGIWIVLGALTSYFGLLDFGLRGAVGRHIAFHHSNGNQQAVNQTLRLALNQGHGERFLPVLPGILAQWNGARLRDL